MNKHYDPSKPNLLLNSHHDTVLPNKAYTRDPHKAEIIDGKLFGLGSNDAGGALVSLLGLFVHFYAAENLTYNLIVAATAEEESSGPNGLNSLLKDLPNINVAIVGEPTQMQLAIAEIGLVVFDAVVKGTAGHAAHPNNDNPILKSMDVMQWFQNLEFDKVSDTLGPVKLTITQINAGSQHNVVPSQVNLVLDVRVNECYTNQEIADIVSQAPCEVTPRSLRLQASSINEEHPLVVAGIAMGLIKEGDDFSVLSDILGDEDHLGDMDFKVAGTKDGITSLQMDIKITGITFEIMEQALNQAKMVEFIF